MKTKGKALLVQMCMDYILFGITNEGPCQEFEMGRTGELTFFLELQIRENIDGMFIN